MSKVEFRIDGAEADYFILTIHGRNIPNATDYWDGNYLWCTAEVVAGAFGGSSSNVIRNEDLTRFLARLEALSQQLDGEALFDTLDDWLDIRIIGDGRGKFEVSGQLCDTPVGGNQLDFQFPLDQTCLPRLMEQVRAALGSFPIVGRQPN